MKKKKVISDIKLLEIIIESIKEKKGKDIVSIDLGKTGSTVCDYFVICHGESKTQVNAIADYVVEKVKENLGISSGHSEGDQNAHWVLLDYFSIVVHVFQPEYRIFYNLEDLWADGVSTSHDDT